MQVLVEFVRGLVMGALHGGFLNRAVHAFDLTVRPRMGRLGQAVLHAVFAADTVKAVPTGQELGRLGRELHPVVRQYGMCFVGQLIQHSAQKFGGYDALGSRMQLSKRHLAGAVDGDEEVLAAFFGLDLGKIDVQVADGIVLWDSP